MVALILLVSYKYDISNQRLIEQQETTAVEKKLTDSITSDSNEEIIYEQDEQVEILTIDNINLKTSLRVGDVSDKEQGALSLGGSISPYSTSDNLVISGHRYLEFRKLKDISVNDDITVQTANGTKQYNVTSIDITKANENLEVDSSLILYTCYPFIDFAPINERFVVRAELTN